MKSTTKVYQIAKRLHMHLNQLDESQPLLHTIQDISEVNVSKDSKNENIFKNNQQLRIRKLEVEKDRKFELMGGGIVIEYSQMKNKRRNDVKFTINHQAQSISSHKSVRQLSPFIGSIYLTKDQVLRLHTPHSSTLGIKSLRKSSQTYHGKHQFKVTETQRQNVACSFNQKVYNSSKQKFSLAKLKRRLQQYQESWTKQIASKKQLKFCGLRRQKRTKRFSNEKNENNFKIKYKQVENATNYSWAQNLRTQTQKDKKQASKRQRRETHGLAISGRSKLKKQTIWIQDQHNKGYFFLKNKQLPEC